MRITLDLRNQSVTAEGSRHRDRYQSWFELEELLDESGDQLDWDLSDDELEVILQAFIENEANYEDD